LKDIALEVHPESKDKIKNHWRTQGKAGNVHEVFPDGEGGDSHLLTNPGADAKNLPFNEVPEFFHLPNIINPLYSIKFGKRTLIN